MDQKQARPQTVSRARARESANGNAVGLPHLQPAAVGQTAKNWFPGSCDLLKRDRTIRSAHNQKRNKSETLHPTKTLQIDGFFTASVCFFERVGHSSLRSLLESWKPGTDEAFSARRCRFFSVTPVLRPLCPLC